MNQISPYQELTQFHLANEAEKQRLQDRVKVQALHPDFSDAQIDAVLNGSLGVAGDWQNDLPQPVAPVQRWQIPRATAQPTPKAVPVSPILADELIRRRGLEKQMFTLDDDKKAPVQAAIDALTADIEKAQQPAPNPEDLLPSSPAKFGDKYKIGKNVFQSFSPTKLPPGARIQIGDDVQTGEPTLADKMKIANARFGNAPWSIPTANLAASGGDINAPYPKASGGYKIGAKYKGGLKYLGGDPNDEASWEKVQ